MAEKNTVQVLIGGRVVRLSGYESEEYLERVAHYMNHKQEELAGLKGWRRFTSETKGTLLALNIADDYFKAKDKAELLEEDIQKKDQELYDLRQELVSLQVLMENMKRNPQPGRNQNNNGSGSRR